MSFRKFDENDWRLAQKNERLIIHTCVTMKNISPNEESPDRSVRKVLAVRSKGERLAAAFVERTLKGYEPSSPNHTGFLQVSVDQKVDLITGETHRV